MEKITQFCRENPIKTAAAGIAAASIFGIKNYTRGGINKYKTSLEGKLIIVTGGTSGIGKEAAKHFYKLGADVVITGRNSTAAEKIIKSLPAPKTKQAKMRFERVDFADIENIKIFAEKMLKDYQKIDILVNNAGLFLSSYRTTKQGLEMTMGVNHLAPVYLTSLLFPLLSKGHEARIINVSSRAHKRLSRTNRRGKAFEEDFWQNLDDTDYNAKNKFSVFNTYCWSKLANVWFTKHLSNLIEKHNGDFEAEKKFNIRVAALHPGVVATGFLRDLGSTFTAVAYLIYPLIWLMLKTEWEGCQSILSTVLCPFEELVLGGYYSDCAEFQPTKLACNEERQNWCWKATGAKIEELTGGYKIFDQL